MISFFILMGHEVVNCATNIGCVHTPLAGFWYLLTTGSLELVFEAATGVQIYTMWKGDK